MPSNDNISNLSTEELERLLAERRGTAPTLTKDIAPRQPQDHRPAYSGGYRGRATSQWITTPSGENVLVQKVGLQGLIEAGLIDSLDTLTNMVQTVTIPRAEGRRVQDPTEGIDLKNLDPEKLKGMVEMMDKIVMHVMVEPKLSPLPQPVPLLDAEGHEQFGTDGKVRTHVVIDPEVDYITLVPDEDKAFIMSYAMGASANLQQFREGSAAAVAGGDAS